ncbi:MAG: hypothetical protein PHI05_00395 [Bacilli bacterium]|nr:hypothetical protein [Bacilli bacterium]
MDLKTEQPKIYILSGKARSGKDTVAKVIKTVCEENNLKYINLQYSSYIKEYAKRISNWDGSDETKPRTLLQQLGTEVIRQQIDEMFFVKRIISDIKVYSNFFDVITISDARYKEEIEFPKEEFEDVISISVVRPSGESSLTEEQQQHLSEKALDGYDKHDYVITNDKELVDLENETRKILEKTLLEK